MKGLTMVFISLLALVACTQPEKNKHTGQNRVDSLEGNLHDVYKPGLGEFMSGIQVHHAKLWFAGQNKNWKLAAFEVTEMKEALASIRKYCADRPETNSIIMMDQPMDSVDHAIGQKDLRAFNRSYLLMTQTCNACHQVTNHEFNVIKTPDLPPFSNQEFKVK